MDKRLSLVCIACLCSTFFLAAQTSREHIKTKIDSWGTCKTVSISKNSGNVAVYNKNGWAGGGIPEKLAERLTTINNENYELIDVELTEKGNWFVHYAGEGLAWEGIPETLEENLKKFSEAKEQFLNVTFNDKEEWIILTNSHVAASSTALLSKINTGRDRYGEILWTHLTDDGLALVYRNGYLFYGDVPENLKTALGNTQLNVTKLKFLSSGAFFIGDKKGAYSFTL